MLNQVHFLTPRLLFSLILDYKIFKAQNVCTLETASDFYKAELFYNRTSRFQMVLSVSGHYFPNGPFEVNLMLVVNQLVFNDNEGPSTC